MNISSSPQISVNRIKNLSKKLNISINDIILSSLTTSLKSLFMQQNDDSTHIQMLLPANIRFGFYKNKEDVKLENRFSAMTLNVPLTDTMQSAYGKIVKIT